MFQTTQPTSQLSSLLGQEAFMGLYPLISSCFSQLQVNLSQKEELLKPDEVCELLKVSIPTLNGLVKSRNFHRYTFNEHRGVYYKRSEIMQALRKME